MSFKEIGLIGGVENSHQSFTALLGDVYASFDLNFIWTTQQWSMDIRADGKPVALGLFLLPNSILLELSEHILDIGVLAFVGEEPTLINLGVNNHLLWSRTP